MSEDDSTRFGPDAIPTLQVATADMGWLLERGYAATASLKLVGDRHALDRRQRKAVMRGCAAPSVATARQDARRSIDDTDVAIDGFNVLVTLETAHRGGPLFRGADGLLRDLAGMHGKYKDNPRIEAIIDQLRVLLQPARSVRWVLDRPVSNSGALAGRLRAAGFDQVALTDLADRALAESGCAVATADGPLLDRAGQGVDVVSPIVAQMASPWIVPLV
ncbi:MAG: DUF434 domain-containing protein [Myxococcota bacterium]